MPRPDDPVVGDRPPNAVPPAPAVQRMEPEDGLVDPFPMRAEQFLIGPDGRTVVVRLTGGLVECFGVAAVDVQATDPPSIAISGGRRPGAGCDAIGVPWSVLVTLAAPIVVDRTNPAAEPGEPQVSEEAIAVQPVNGLANPRDVAVTGYGLSPDGMTLSVHYVGGTEDCYGLAVVDIKIGDDGTATVLISEGSRPNAAVACEDIGVAKVVTVPLEQPLLVDGSGH
jgi:hypothetical protein